MRGVRVLLVATGLSVATLVESITLISAVRRKVVAHGFSTGDEVNRAKR
jgi:hypothetical protein